MPSGRMQRREPFGERFAHAGRKLRRRDAAIARSSSRRRTGWRYCPGQPPRRRWRADATRRRGCVAAAAAWENCQDEEESANNVVVPSAVERETTARVAAAAVRTVADRRQHLLLFYRHRRRHRQPVLRPSSALRYSARTPAGWVGMTRVCRSTAHPCGVQI
jgi:hypothetical protein